MLKIVDCYHPNTFLGSGYLQHGGANKNLGNSSNSQETWRWKWINSRDHLEATDLFESCQSQRIIRGIIQSHHPPTLPKFNSEFSPKKLPKPNKKRSIFQPPIFSGAMWNFGGVDFRCVRVKIYSFLAIWFIHNSRRRSGTCSFFESFKLVKTRNFVSDSNYHQTGRVLSIMMYRYIPTTNHMGRCITNPKNAPMNLHSLDSPQEGKSIYFSCHM